MYRTGDLVRRLASGALEYLGRMDHQIKLRGFRIELGEVEQAASALPNAERAIAAVREVAPGDARLVCYYVGAGAGAGAPDAASLRSALRRRLPHFMVPSAFVRLDAFPLTPNGKIDRKALPAPEPDTLDRTPYVAPRTPAESRLAEIWREALRVERVGIRDNFFDLGGHSLVAMRIVSRVQQAFGSRLQLNTVVEHPTIEELAPLVHAMTVATTDPATPSIRRVARVATRRAGAAAASTSVASTGAQPTPDAAVDTPPSATPPEVVP
jgi:acyl carrier protein